MYKVLIAEDEMFVRMGIKMSVEWEKLEMKVVADVENGQLALEAYEKFHPDIVITDIKMPIMDGVELIQKIRSSSEDTRIIILSCLQDFDIIKLAMSYGVTDYILKLTMTQEDMERVLLKTKKEIRTIKTGKDAEKGKYSRGKWEKLLWDSLYYPMYSEGALEERLKNAGCPLVSTNMVLTVITIDNYREIQQIFEDQYGSLISSSFENIITELMLEYGGSVLLYEKENRYILLLGQEGNYQNYEVEKLVNEFLNRVRRVIKQYFHGSLTIAVSQVFHGLLHLHAMYEQANKIIQQRFYYGAGQTLTYRNMMCDSLEMVKKEMDWLTQTLKMDEVVRKQLDAGSRYLSENSGPENIRNFFEHMIHAELDRIIQNEKTRLEVTKDFQGKLRQSLTLHELAECYVICINSLYGEAGRGQVLSKTVSDIIHYISKNYKNTITLENISDTVELTPNYVCSLFKKEMGMTIVNYIMLYRINKAKALIMNTNMRSYEIAAKVGFTDESYFSRSFKKITGCSPNDYKKNAGEKRIGDT
jgi:two-component system, response regulator YesN